MAELSACKTIGYYLCTQAVKFNAQAATHSGLPTTTKRFLVFEGVLQEGSDQMIYHRIGLSGAHCYLAHTAYQAHIVFLTKSIQTLDKKRTALIERKFGVGEVKNSQLDLSKHAVRTRITLQQPKRARNVKRTIKTSLNHLPSPFSTRSLTASFR